MHGIFLHVTTFICSHQLLSRKQHNVLELLHVLSSVVSKFSNTENMIVAIFTNKIDHTFFVGLTKMFGAILRAAQWQKVLSRLLKNVVGMF